MSENQVQNNQLFHIANDEDDNINTTIGDVISEKAQPEESDTLSTTNINNVDDGKRDIKNNVIGMTENSKTSNLFLTMINICNMIIGSGVIVLSNALSQSGIFLGITLLIFNAVLADFSILALAKSGALTDKFTYQSVVNKALGRPGIVIISLCQIMYPLFAVISYSIAIRDNIRGIVQYFYHVGKGTPWYLDDRVLLAIITAVVIFPLSSLRNISKLDKASFCSVLLVFVYIGCVFYNVFILPYKMFYPKGFIAYGRSGFVSSINVYAFALSCQHNVLPMFRSMRGLSVKKFGIATHMALLITTVLYILVAISGYVTFSGNASGNLLKDYCSSDTVILVARLAFSATVMLTSPLQIYSCREAISTLILKITKYTNLIHYSITIALLVVCYLSSIFISDIENVTSLSGALVASPVVFILPALSLMLLMRQGITVNNYTKIGCIITITFGCIVLLVGTGVSIYNFIKSPSRPIQYWCNDCYRIYPKHILQQLVDKEDDVLKLWSN